MARKIGKQKVSQREYDNYVAKLDTAGGTITGNLTLSSETSDFLLNTPLVQNGEVTIQAKNDNTLTSVLQTVNTATELLYNIIAPVPIESISYSPQDIVLSLHWPNLAQVSILSTDFFASSIDLTTFV